MDNEGKTQLQLIENSQKGDLYSFKLLAKEGARLAVSIASKYDLEKRPEIIAAAFDGFIKGYKKYVENIEETRKADYKFTTYALYFMVVEVRKLLGMSTEHEDIMKETSEVKLDE